MTRPILSTLSRTLLAAIWAASTHASHAHTAAAGDASAAQAPPEPAEIQSVSVSAVRDPEIKSYRAMLAGLDAFDKHRARAPAAPELRFMLSPLSNKPSTDYANVKLTIRGDTVSIPVPIDADNSFVLPRDKQADAEKADLVLDLRKGQIRGRPEVRTPGVPANARRLGDLRLECEVRSAIARSEMNFVFRSAIATATLGSGLCESKRMKMGFFAGKPIKALTLVADTRRVPLTSFAGAHYFPPVGDKSWPDDTLLEFEFEPPAS
ncbi:MAG: hypothetical protein ACLGI6_04910 [Gammaproteobacteria bacterium]